MAKRVKVFISSPHDVELERQRAALVISRLKREFQRFFDLTAVVWELEPMLAHGHFQDIIERPSECDIFAMILWSRLGTPLPEKTEVREYRAIDGHVPVTGTEWEFEDALTAKKKRGAPDLLVYRKREQFEARIKNLKEVNQELAEIGRQWTALQAFWGRYFEEPEGGFKLAFSEFKLLDEFENKFETDLRKLLLTRVTSRTARVEMSWHHGSPFCGLSTFEARHAAVFFGRSQAEREVIEALTRRSANGCSFLLVLGASGVGKSSLVQAGVLPTLTQPGVQQGVAFWRHCVFRPGVSPIQRPGVFVHLAQSLAQPYGDQPAVLRELTQAGISADDLAAQFRTAPTHAPLLIKVALTRASEKYRQRAEGRLVLVIDQLEELFGLVEREERQGFASLLAAFARSGCIWVIATMRSDFYAQIASLPLLRDLASDSGQYLLRPPRPPEIAQMIREPAKAAGITFEINDDGIGLDAVLQEAAAKEPGALPLLEFVLDELYRSDVEKAGSSEFKFSTYKALDSFEGAIATRAEAICEKLSSDQERVLRSILLSLVAAGEKDQSPIPSASIVATARLVPRREIETEPQRKTVLSRLVEARLVVASEAEVRIAHEALIDRWPRLNNLIKENWKFIQERDRIKRERVAWEANGHQNDLLLPSGTRLREAEELLNKYREDLDPATVAYIEESLRSDHSRSMHDLQRMRLTTAGHELLRVAQTYEHGAVLKRRQEAEAVRRLISGLIAIDPENFSWLHRLSSAHHKLGDILRDDGDINGAVAEYKACLEVMEKLVQQMPDNLGWQKDLLSSKAKLSELLPPQQVVDH